MSETTAVEKSVYHIMDNEDGKQITEADVAIKQALAYEAQGKKTLSYLGIKWLVLKMSQKEQPLEISMPDVQLVKYVDEDQTTWHWQACVKVRNAKTGLETIGASEQAFIDFNGYDNFGRTKAISKAERNAYRKQIPELEIQLMLDSLKGEEVKKLNVTKSTTSQPQNGNGSTKPEMATAKQIKYLQDLGYKGPAPTSKFEAMNIIDKIVKEAKK